MAKSTRSVCGGGGGGHFQLANLALVGNFLNVALGTVSSVDMKILAVLV